LIGDARGARDVAQPPTQISFKEAHRKFIADCRAGRGLEQPRRALQAEGDQKPRLRSQAGTDPIRLKELVEVAGGELQEAIDDYLPEKPRN